MSQKKLDWRIIIAAISAITVIEVVALLKDINGALLVLVVGAIAGLGGWVLPPPYNLKGGK